MGTKSDFAEKLLHDLRLRKDKMSATPNSTPQNSQMCRDYHKNAPQAYRGAQYIKPLENSSRRPNGGSRSFTTKETPNQIILYERGKNSTQVKDLSMAIAFAFQKTENLSKIASPSCNNPLVKFFNRFGPGSLDFRKMESLSTYNVSHIHITEMSKGVQKLNQILKSRSDGLNFDRNSVEFGKELFKGAIDLEESLRMLVSLQEASDYMNVAQQKGRLRLIEKDKDGQENSTDKLAADQRRVDRPRFSFDKRSQVLAKSNSKMISHGKSASCIPDFDSSTQMKPKNQLISSQSAEGKGRISNVVAKLMGLEEIPQKENYMCIQKDLSSKGKLSSKSTQLSERFNVDSKNSSFIGSDRMTIESNNASKIRDMNCNVRAGNRPETTDDSSQMVKSEINQGHKDLKILAVGMDVVSGRKMVKLTTNKQENHSAKPNKVAGFQVLHDSETKQNLTGDRERKIIEAQKKFPAKSVDRVQVLKRPERQDDRRAELKGLQLRERTLMSKKHKGPQVESIISSKTIKSGGHLLKKRKNDKTIPENGKSIKPRGKDPPSSRDVYEKEQNQNLNHENFHKEDRSQSRSPREPVQEKPIGISATQKKAVSNDIQKSENPRKMDLTMTRRSGNVNGLTRSSKQSSNMLQDLKQQMHKKNGGEVGRVEPIKQKDELQNESEKTTLLDNVVRDECQELNTQEIPAPNDNCDDVSLDFGKVSDDLLRVEQLCASRDEQELEKHDQSSGRSQEQLTEPEKELKEIVIKSQQFLNKAEALFKLNIPVTFLYAVDRNDEVRDNKLILDCGYEIMKRTARRYEIALHSYTLSGINFHKIRSLDDLVRKLCKNFEMLKFYGGNGDEEHDIAESLHQMLEKDINNKDSDVNSMWDNMMFMFSEKEDVVRDLEKHMLNVLLDEITNDLLLIPVSV
ncbi:hypothetical protein BUALT_Bualt08G0069300 [Buddleja alternifolia]|uniref:DUF3741 domain-containing protein n=1 Tax=Buddleja alternifolia TaxID=168488 RepID=A0AAV6XBK8_9LAMI|nr:hypothetical protein BUALT_Bualt08G0069300 [Buddleja alternifolia]